MGIRRKSLDDKGAENDAIEAFLTQAFRDDKFYLVYQPIYKLTDTAEQIDAEIIAFEALARLKTKDNKTLLPDSFIEFFENEDSALTVEFGMWTIQEALKVSLIYPEKIWVNISAACLLNSNFIDWLVCFCETNNVKDNINFEITESCPVFDIDKFKRHINKIKGLEIDLILDDFGSGYSSMKHIQIFPVNFIKIDKSYIKNIETTAIDQMIVQGFLRFFNEINLDVVIEGVENATQMKILKGFGGKYFQGFFFSTPVKSKVLPEIPKNDNFQY